MKPYRRDSSKRDQVREMFDGIAPAYDRLNHLLSLGIDRLWRRKLVREVSRQAPERLLDLATGTGDMALALAKKTPHAAITAADLSPGMLEVAKAKATKAGLADRIEFAVAEAERLPFRDGDFDAVTIVFGIRNFEDIPAALGEAARVLDEGGRLYILEFSPPTGKIFPALFRFYFHRIVPAVGGRVAGDREAYEYLPGSVDEFPAPRAFAAMMEQAGFAVGKIRPMTSGVANIFIARKR